MIRAVATLVGALWLATLFPTRGPIAQGSSAAHDESAQFQTSDNCIACHNGLTTAAGEDVSIGSAWRASMMANSSRDPYWQASVRRETIDHPLVKTSIEDECSICHMPMTATLARQGGRPSGIFEHLPVNQASSTESRLAADGVSCTLCHQIGSDRFGTPQSFTGGYVVNPTPAGERPRMFGPFEVDKGRSAVMHSATGVQPAEAKHVRESELCATCHTLVTQAFGPQGEAIGRLPEQTPYLEWRHSEFRRDRSCQSCHMPAVEMPTPVSSVLGEPRERMGRHGFLGGNFFMLRLLNRYRDELGVAALPQELDAAAHQTLHQLQTDTATVSLDRVTRDQAGVTFEVIVSNLTGHKLPTGYPSRRTWLHVTVRGAADDRPLFESGAVSPGGAIHGNDNDEDDAGMEPHYEVIRTSDQVQIYESVMRDSAGVPTTGLLRATGYAKDNRLLPRGFDKATAEPDIAVHGEAAQDPTFREGGDRVRYTVAAAAGPITIEVELRYQPIAYRWAQNLRRYQSAETERFLRMHDAIAPGSSAVLARTTTQVN